MPVEMRQRQILLLEKAIGSVESQLAAAQIDGISMRYVHADGDITQTLTSRKGLFAAAPPFRRSSRRSKISLLIILAMAITFGIQFGWTFMGRAASWDELFSLIGAGVGFIGIVAVAVVQAVTWKRNHD